MSLFDPDAFSTRATRPVRPGGDRCPRCVHRAGRCERCRRRLARRRARRAIQLLQQGGTVREVAARLGVDRTTVRRYVRDSGAAAVSRRTIANAPIRDAVREALAADPQLTLDAIARRAGLGERRGGTYLRRLLGMSPTATAIKNGKPYPGRIRTDISVEHAVRIVRAIGRAPVDFDGL